MPVIITLVVFVLLSFCGIFLFFYIKKHRIFVEKNSIALDQLSNINEKYNFENVFPSIDPYYFDNAKLFNEVSCEDYLIYQIQSDKNIEKQFLYQISQIEYNEKAYKKYYNEIGEVVKYGVYKENTSDFNKRLLDKIEKSLFEKLLIKPQIKFELTVRLYRTDLKGEVFNSKRAQFSAQQIKALVDKIHDKKGNHFNDQDIWNAICRMERGKVSNAMRFHIYERDGYKCLCCGRNQYETKLEIDHINPISRGGKSTEDNLQTLCETCNNNKGNEKIDFR